MLHSAAPCTSNRFLLGTSKLNVELLIEGRRPAWSPRITVVDGDAPDPDPLLWLISVSSRSRSQPEAVPRRSCFHPTGACFHFFEVQLWDLAVPEPSPPVPLNLICSIMPTNQRSRRSHRRPRSSISRRPDPPMAEPATTGRLALELPLAARASGLRGIMVGRLRTTFIRCLLERRQRQAPRQGPSLNSFSTIAERLA